MLFGAGKSTNALFKCLIMGWDLRIGQNINYLNGRKGPLKFMVILTTMIMVINRILAKIIKVLVVVVIYKMFILWFDDGNIGELIIVLLIIIYIGNIDDINISEIYGEGSVWLGVIATK